MVILHSRGSFVFVDNKYEGKICYDCSKHLVRVVSKNKRKEAIIINSSLY